MYGQLPCCGTGKDHSNVPGMPPDSKCVNHTSHVANKAPWSCPTCDLGCPLYQYVAINSTIYLPLHKCVAISAIRCGTETLQISVGLGAHHHACTAADTHCLGAGQTRAHVWQKPHTSHRWTTGVQGRGFKPCSLQQSPPAATSYPICSCCKPQKRAGEGRVSASFACLCWHSVPAQC